jgi:hypothetical protein
MPELSTIYDYMRAYAHLLGTRILEQFPALLKTHRLRNQLTGLGLGHKLPQNVFFCTRIRGNVHSWSHVPRSQMRSAVRCRVSCNIVAVDYRWARRT